MGQTGFQNFVGQFAVTGVFAFHQGDGLPQNNAVAGGDTPVVFFNGKQALFASLALFRYAWISLQ